MTVLRTRAEWDRWAVFVTAQGFPLDATAKPYKPTRSNEQNNYLFGVAYPPIADATGYEVDGDNGIHAFMCGTHFGWVDKACPKTPANPNGVRSVPFRTTTRNEHGERDVLNKADFSKFVDTVKRIGAQAGVFIPDAQVA